MLFIFVIVTGCDRSNLFVPSIWKNQISIFLSADEICLLRDFECHRQATRDNGNDGIAWRKQFRATTNLSGSANVSVTSMLQMPQYLTHISVILMAHCMRMGFSIWQVCHLTNEILYTHWFCNNLIEHIQTRLILEFHHFDKLRLMDVTNLGSSWMKDWVISAYNWSR
jgi:hypothetical protein